jgi:hypothetical protein
MSSSHPGPPSRRRSAEIRAGTCGWPRVPLGATRWHPTGTGSGKRSQPSGAFQRAGCWADLAGRRRARRRRASAASIPPTARHGRRKPETVERGSDQCEPASGSDTIIRSPDDSRFNIVARSPASADDPYPGNACDSASFARHGNDSFHVANELRAYRFASTDHLCGKNWPFFP